MKNLQAISLTLLLLASFNVSAQIVTSKKEAQKKGIYSYSDKQASQTGSTAQRTETVLDKPSATNGIAAVSNEPVKTDNRNKRGPRKSEASPKKNKWFVDSEEPDPDFEPETTPYLAQQIVNNAMQFEGVRYRGGGTSRDGMDCSGMVYATFKIFDITLPRSSRDMAQAGEEVKLDEVKKGDLLFFDNNRSRRGINHVGLVTEITPEGEVKFLHSATHGGVIVSSMSEAYYERTFVQASRVVAN